MVHDLFPIGQAYGRPDLERIGQFAEMGYLVGKRYTPNVKDISVRDLKKRQMYPGGSKVKTDLQDIYFDQEYKRIFIGEGINWRKLKGAKKKDIVSEARRPFYPPHKTVKIHYIGDPYGTIDGVLSYYTESGRPRPKPQYVPQKRGIYTKPGKKGGPGFHDITIHAFPNYMSSRYEPKIEHKEVKLTPFLHGGHPDYFDSNPFRETRSFGLYRKETSVPWTKFGPFYPSSKTSKEMEGEWPKHMADTYIDPWKVEAVTRARKLKLKTTEEVKKKVPFYPQSRNKTLESYSIMTRKVQIATNAKTWSHMKPITYTKRVYDF